MEITPLTDRDKESLKAIAKKIHNEKGEVAKKRPFIIFDKCLVCGGVMWNSGDGVTCGAESCFENLPKIIKELFDNEAIAKGFVREREILVEQNEKLAEQVHASILDNYGGKGIFRHMGTHGGLSGKIRGRIGSFADQVYPSYALSVFAQAFNRKEALDPAIETAKTVCRLQGELGQWWWHYDAKSGGVLGRYPVYSVHQYGMAPMMLFMVGESAGLDFSRHIYLGLEWVSGKNEIAESLVDIERQMIWRNISPTRTQCFRDELRSLIKKPEGTPTSMGNGLFVLRESRPYCFGWLLYAFAGKDQT